MKRKFLQMLLTSAFLWQGLSCDTEAMNTRVENDTPKYSLGVSSKKGPGEPYVYARVTVLVEPATPSRPTSVKLPQFEQNPTLLSVLSRCPTDKFTIYVYSVDDKKCINFPFGKCEVIGDKSQLSEHETVLGFFLKGVRSLVKNDPTPEDAGA